MAKVLKALPLSAKVAIGGGLVAASAAVTYAVMYNKSDDEVKEDMRLWTKIPLVVIGATVVGLAYIKLGNCNGRLGLTLGIIAISLMFIIIWSASDIWDEDANENMPEIVFLGASAFTIIGMMGMAVRYTSKGNKDRTVDARVINSK
jgi:ABC-type spermidine/putrescine transport system permease subunit II